jgi:hypothetical protein
MPRVRAQVVFQGASELPEDRFINTFHFNPAGGTLEDAAAAINPLLASFYGSGTGSLTRQFSPWIQPRIATTNYYDLADPTPRVPVVSSFAIATPDSGGGLPEEVAVCLTLKGDPPESPRRRGRLYIGPLVANTNVINFATNLAQSSVSGALRVILQIQAGALLTAAGPLNWSIYSRVTDTMVPVTHGHIDNAFDIIRKRGPDATLRTLWPA